MLRPHRVALPALSLLLPIAACAGRSASVADAGPPGPALAFVSLTSPVGCDADADLDTDGVQLDVTVELTDDDGSGFAQVQLMNALNGASATGSLEGGAASLRIDVVASSAPASDNPLSITSTNESGRLLEASAVVTVDCLPPSPSVTCAFTSPANAAVIAADNVDVAITCVSEHLTAAQRAMMASARMRLDAVATSDGSARASELDLTEGAAAGNVLLPGTGAHVLTATLVDTDGLFDPDPSVSLAIDVAP